MRKANSSQGKWQNAVFPLTASLIVVADQLSKTWIRANLDIHEVLFELGLFRIIRIRPNTGAAFGLFQDNTFLLTIASIVAVGILIAYVVFFRHRFPMLNHTVVRVGTGLILGGTIGNLIDRLRFGAVTDFVDAGSWWAAFNTGFVDVGSLWAAFNVADASITTGAVMFATFLIVLSQIIKDKNGQSIQSGS